MADHIHYAAHVDHPIAHSSEIGRLTLGLGAVAIAAIVIVGTGGGAAILTFAAASTISGAYGVGNTLGTLVDTYIAPPSNECFIQSGIDSVRLGTGTKPAARSDHDDTKTRGWHTKKMAEGSKIVMLGPETRPMSRVGDRSECGGKISDGLRSLVVGGVPSKDGVDIDEQTSTSLWAITLAFDLVGAVGTGGSGGKLNVARGVAQGIGAVVGGDVQTATGLATTTMPKNALDVHGAGKTGFDATKRALQVLR